MLLADLGATVLRIDRTADADADVGVKRALRHSLVLRNREAVSLDLKQPAAIDLVLRFVEGADALIDPFRPGVIERLGLGPAVCHARNPRLVIGRMTGWGQTGPLAQAAGHDLNYIALSGLLHAISRAGQPPTPPLNLLGDYGGGAMFLALGLVSAILEARQSKQGQVVDAAMLEGAATLGTLFYGTHAAGAWDPRRGHNYIDSGAPYYDVYACADGKWLAVAAIEDRFYAALIRGLNLDAASLPNRQQTATSMPAAPCWPARPQGVGLLGDHRVWRGRVPRRASHRRVAWTAGAVGGAFGLRRRMRSCRADGDQPAASRSGTGEDGAQQAGKSDRSASRGC